MALALLANMVLGIVSEDYFICDGLNYKYNWHVAIIINTVICYLNIINGLILFKMRGKVDQDDYFSVSKRDKARIRKQMLILIYGYASISTLILVWFIIFPYILAQDDVKCVNGSRYWVPRTEFAGAAALVKTYLLFCPTLLFWL